MGNNPLSAGSIARLMATSLPAGDAGESTPTTALRNPYEATALFFHSCMLAAGFGLVGLNEDDKLESSESLPPSWNAAGSSFSFRYAHPQATMEFLVKVSRLGSKAVVNAIALGDEKTASFEVDVGEFIATDGFPLDVPDDAQGEARQSRLQETFQSPARMMDLSTLFKLKILQKIIPSLEKDGQAGGQRSSLQESSAVRAAPPPQPQPRDPHPDPAPARPHPLADPLAQPPLRRPVPDFEPPGFEDEHQMQQPRGQPFPPAGRHPLNIGEDDLYPPGMGPLDPLRPSLGPGLPRPGGPGGGMHPTFDDPLFTGGHDPQSGRYDPRIPPGARYDPTHSGDEPPQGAQGTGPRFPGGRGGPFGGGGGGGGPGGRPPNPFGGFGSGDFI